LYFDKEISLIISGHAAKSDFIFSEFGEISKIKDFQKRLLSFYTEDANPSIELPSYANSASKFKSKGMMIEYRHCLKRICKLKRLAGKTGQA
jgi:hypothetical protein